ncbi:MAG: aspartate aminotransferase family protein [Lutibacter sp.]
MEMYQVYSLYNVTPVKAEGVYVWDENNTKYLDLYGGHGVISIGHSHPYYISQLTDQLNKIGFYSNAIQNPLQEQLAKKLGELSGCSNYNLFLCNSGAEANENALKLASFINGKSKIIAFENAFHGRTSAAVSATDNSKIRAEINNTNVIFLPLNNIELVLAEIEKEDVSAIIIEGIQGVGGLDEGTSEFFQQLEKLCKKNEVLLILDEVQSGYGRSGKFFAFQYHNIHPDIITVAKGMGNGFPIGGVLIKNKYQPVKGSLGTTFGGNHLACSAAIAVLDILKEEQLINHVQDLSKYFEQQVQQISQVKKVKGKGLMLGLEFNFEVAELRKKLIEDYHIFTGGSNNKNLLRILPPLTVSKSQIDEFINALKQCLYE